MLAVSVSNKGANTTKTPKIPDPRTMVAKFFRWWSGLWLFHFICLVSLLSYSLLFCFLLFVFAFAVLCFLGYVCFHTSCRAIHSFAATALDTLRHSCFHFGLFPTLFAIVSRNYDVESCSVTHHHSFVCLLYYVQHALACNAAFPRRGHADFYGFHLRSTFSFSPQPSRALRRGLGCFLGQINRAAAKKTSMCVGLPYGVGIPSIKKRQREVRTCIDEPNAEP